VIPLYKLVHIWFWLTLRMTINTARIIDAIDRIRAARQPDPPVGEAG
jgi:hypothetical protein